MYKNAQSMYLSYSTVVLALLTLYAAGYGIRFALLIVGGGVALGLAACWVTSWWESRK